MRIDVLTLFPEMVAPALSHSILGRAREAGLLRVGVHDIRDHADGRHKVVDDTPYGGGSGMVMRVDVVDRAIAAVRGEGTHVVLTDPAGIPLTHDVAQRLAGCEHLVIVAGHYEGIDARVREHLVDEALSIGDYVLTGGELAACVIADAAARLVPGVLGNAESLATESFTGGLLEAPVYTRPREYRGWEVPEVLLSGHHGNIERWRAERAQELTRALRPDLLDDEG